MAKLHFLLDGNSLGEFELDKERMTIGRRPTNQIHIDNLAVSGVHAVIVTIGNDSFLEDLNSTNGTTVNGKTIKKYVLQHEDIIEFGKYQLKYINENHKSDSGDGFEKTMMILPKQEPQVAAKVLQEKQQVAEKVDSAPVEELSQTEDDATETIETETTQAEATEIVENESEKTAAENIGRLQVLSGASAGRELLLNKTMTTLGKPGSQVAVITKRPHGYFITHVGGNNHPTVNGLTIGVQAHALNDQDIIELAGTKMEFHLA
jgi:pSer/pThr/pTyr-binding forkhead associated (FHA) protein